MADNNDLILLDIGGRPRPLRFNHSALKVWSAETGKEAGEFQPSRLLPDDMEFILWCMLFVDAAKRDETVTRERVVEWMDELPLTELYGKIMGAIAAAFPPAKDPQKPVPAKKVPAQGKTKK